MEKVFPPESVTGYKQPPPQEKGFAASTAAAAGMTKQAIKRRRQIWEALHPGDPVGGKNLPTNGDDLRSDGRRKGPQHEQGFAASTAAAAGMTKQAIKRRRQIREALGFEESGTTCPTLDKPSGGRGNISFAAETAAITGESKRDINRHLARADALGDDLERIVGTSLDKGVELDALKAMPEPERKELIEKWDAEPLANS